MPETHRKVGDLIEVPELRTVIRLADVDDPRVARVLGRDFVFTDDTVKALRLLRRSLGQDTGEGFFLIGSYGSGKSHLLAVLSLWVEDGPEAKVKLPPDSPLETPLFPRRQLVVRCSLVDHRGSEPLEECVLRAAEARLAALGHHVALTPERQHLTRLVGALTDAQKAELGRMLKAQRLPDVDELIRTGPREAVARVHGMVQEIGVQIPERLQDERPVLFQRLADTARAAGFAGVVLLIDELSEFLRAKPSGRALSEDARFLQFLGESSRSLPLWVVASMQESIEETGDIAKPVLDKIKDRYPIRLRLSTTHVEDLVAARLVHKKKGAQAPLLEIHAQLLRHFPDLKLSAERFARLYPLHPRTLAYLEGLSELFSQARGVVEFVTTHVRGDALRGIPGLLDQDAATLLGIDAIFDHFEARLREHDTFSPYYKKAYQHLERRASELLADPEDQATARRLLKILILTEINPLESRKTVKELAELLLTRVSDLDPRLNYQYLEEAILRPLYEGSNYLHREPAAAGEDSTADRFGIDLALDVRALLRERVEARLGVARGEEARLLRRLLVEVGADPIPLDRIARGEQVTTHVRWLNTERQGELLLGEPADLGEDTLAAALHRLETDETDFLVILREPAQEPRPLPDRLDRADVLIWTPAVIAEEARAQLLAAAVHRALLLDSRGSTEEELRLREILNEEVEKETPRVREQLKQLYLEGSLTLARPLAGFLPVEPPAQAHNLAEALEPAVARALGEAYPEFRRVMPQTEYVNPRALAQAIAELAAHGQLSSSAARSKGILAVLEGVLAPLGLVSLKRGSYALAPDESPGSLPHALLADLAESERLPCREVFHQLRKGPWGLPTILARTVLLTLVHSGHVVAYRSKRSVTPQYLSFETLPTVEELSLGKLVERSVQDDLRGLEFLLKDPLPEFWGLKTQRDVWQRLQAFKQQTDERLERLREAVERYRSVAALAGFEWEDLEAATRPLRELAQAVHVSYDSTRGIESVVEAQRSIQLDQNRMREVMTAERFFERDVDKLLFIHDYVQDASLDGLQAPFAEEAQDLRARLKDLRSLVLGGQFEELERRFGRFREAYREAYNEQHRSQVGEAAYRDLEALAGCPEMKALAALDQIDAISVAHDHARVLRHIEKVRRRRCLRDALAEVYTRASCSCGFVLGEVVEKPQPAEIKALARDGIVEYAAELHAPERRARLLAQAEALEGTEHGESGKALRRLVKALDQGAATRELVLLLDDRTGRAAARALSDTVQVVERNLGDLVEQLESRKLTPDRARDVFDRWLDAADLGAGTFIHVVDSSAPPPSPPASTGTGSPAPRRRHRRRIELLTNGMAAWAAARELDLEDLATRLQLGELTAPENPAAVLAALGPELDPLIQRDERLREGLRELLGFDHLDAVALGNEVLREPALDAVRALAVDRLIALVLAREARADALPDPGGSVFPVPLPGGAIDGVALYRLARHALLTIASRKLDPKDLCQGLLAVDATATLGTRSGALGPATARELLEKSRRLEEAAAAEPADLPGLPDLTEVSGGGDPTLILLVDALRFDLWRALRPVFERLLRRKVSVEELRIAPRESATEAARRRLFGIGPREEIEPAIAAQGLLLVTAAERGHNARQLEDALAGAGASRRVVALNLLDDKVHASSLSPWGLVEAVAGELQISLGPALERVPRDHRVLLVADHGFRQSPAWPRGKERYVHGGPSLLERAVPFVIFA